MTDFFKNGNRRIFRLTLWKLGWGIGTMVLIQVQAMLPQLGDYITPKHQALLAFLFGVILSCSKGVEMFFDKTISMFKNHEIELDDTAK